ncbi:BgTH12-00774 [Blumeria graminis f. sp. triticale]|nr:BgTH12-00774 [Blumeria graminis f. sp. triticale]
MPQDSMSAGYMHNFVDSVNIVELTPRSALHGQDSSSLVRNAEVFSSICVRSVDCPYVVSVVPEYLWMNAVTFYSVLFDWILDHVTDYNMFIIQSVATCSALIWLLFRAWQTLWKPVPELISILGIEVPDPPEVSLASIKRDAITLYWSKPEPQKPVVKYYIQVNGVNVGETSRLETAITVTGLRPGHFYNVRVIAVGPNNFQAGSLVIRLRTYGKDGRPMLGNRRSYSNPTSENFENDIGEESSNRGQAVCLEATALPENLSATHRDTATGAVGNRNSGQRRNTGGTPNGRKYSSSTVGIEPAIPSLELVKESREPMHHLTAQLENVNQEREKIAVEMAKESEEFKNQLTELCREKDDKKQTLKEREEASEKLKKEVNYAERLNRQAQTRKSQKEKLLKEKVAERSKMEEDMKRWKKEIEDMKSERGRWLGEKDKFDKKKLIKTAELRQEIKQRQAALNAIEEDIRIKGLQIKQLEQHRTHILSCDDDEGSRSRDEHEDREWNNTEKAMTAELNAKSRQLRDIGSNLHQQQAYLTTLQQRNSVIFHGNFSNIDFEPLVPEDKEKSLKPRNQKTQTIHSATSRRPVSDTSFHAFGNQSPLSFAPGPYMDIANDATPAQSSDQFDHIIDEDHSLLTAGAPLSPTATSLLPSNIFADEDLPSPLPEPLELCGPIIPDQMIISNIDHSPQLPKSPNKPEGHITSPRASSQNIPRHDATTFSSRENDSSFNFQNSGFGAIGTAVSSKHSTHKGIRDLFSLSKSKTRETVSNGPSLGSLKPNQSSSFPRSIEETGATGNKQRRVTFSSTWSGLLHRTLPTEESSADNNISPSTSRKIRHSILGSGFDEQNGNDINSSSPRPLSVASSDLPRPSTDSAPFGWSPAQDNLISGNVPLATNWFLYGSNHVSLQHQTAWSNSLTGKPNRRYDTSAAFSSRIVSENDGFLPPSDSLTHQYGQSVTISAIGTKTPPLNQTISAPKLNPAAPAFHGFGFSQYDKTLTEQRSQMNPAKEADSSDLDYAALGHANTTSSSTSLQSRHAQSVYTQADHAESQVSLERRSSKSTSEITQSASFKDKDESSLHRLFRKGSSSKFSISTFRNKETTIFSGNKKSSSSIVNLECNLPVERERNTEPYFDDSYSKALDSVAGNPVLGCRNIPSEWTQAKDKDSLNLKEGRLNKSWSRLGIRGKRGKDGGGDEGLMIDNEF